MVEEEGAERAVSAQVSRWEEVSANLEYYLDTEEGRRKLAKMIEEGSRVLIEELRKIRVRVKDIIWLSKWCRQCSHFVEGPRGHMRCGLMGCRIVKPFYGRPVWSVIIKGEGQQEMVVADVDWGSKAFEVNELLIEAVVSKINGGAPYSCYTPKE